MLELMVRYNGIAAATVCINATALRLRRQRLGENGQLLSIEITRCFAGSWYKNRNVSLDESWCWADGAILPSFETMCRA